MYARSEKLRKKELLLKERRYILDVKRKELYDKTQAFEAKKYMLSEKARALLAKGKSVAEAQKKIAEVQKNVDERIEALSNKATDLEELEKSLMARQLKIIEREKIIIDRWKVLSEIDVSTKETPETLNKRGKILITGTGRCGTTFLIILFSILKMETGYNAENYQDFIFQNCNSGMERKFSAKVKILKNPEFISEIGSGLINPSEYLV